MRRGVTACLMVLSLLLGGCWDRSEVEDIAYVTSIGVDAAEDESLWTFRIAEPERMAVGMLTAPPQTRQLQLSSGLITVRGSSLEQAVQLVQAALVRVLSLEHVRGIVFGEKLARKGVLPVINQLQRHNQWRNTVSVHVAAGRAVDVFTSNRPMGEFNPVKFAEGIFLVQKKMHLSPPIRLQHFYGNLLDSGADPFTGLVAVNPTAEEPPGSPLPPMGERSLKAGEFPRTGGNRIEFAGTAIFHGDRLKGTLTVDETAALLALRGEMGKVYASIPDPLEEGTLITLRYQQENKPQYRISLVSGHPVVNIKLQLEGEVLSTPGKTDYSAPENRRKLEDFSAKYVERTTYGPLVRKIYNDWGADPVGLGNLFRMRFPTFNDWLTFRWSDRVKEVEVNVQTTLLIRRFGLLLENPSGQDQGR